MNDVALVHIIPRDRLILLELDGSFLIPLLVVLDPKRRPLDQGMTTRGYNSLRRGNLNVDTSTRQLHQARCKLGLKRGAEDWVSLFRNIAMQNLKPVVIELVDKI